MQFALRCTLAGPGRLDVVRVASGVFKTFVSNQNVANALVVVGATNLSSSCFFFHSSLAAAMEAFRKLPSELEVEDDLSAVVRPSRVPDAAITLAPLGGSTVHGFGLTISRQIHLGTVPLRLLNAADVSSVPAAVPPLRGSTPCHVALGPTAGHASAVIAPRPNHLVPLRSFRDVVLTPPRPVLKPPKTLNPISNTKGCFRCLALDHTVKDCRDPVRYRNCSANGHRSYACPMPLWKIFARRRRAPNVAAPALGRSRSAPSSGVPASPSLSPTLPQLAALATSPNPVTLPPTVAYDPLFMVSSSSTRPPASPVAGTWPPVDKFMIGRLDLDRRPSPSTPPGVGRASHSPPTAPSPPRVPCIPRFPHAFESEGEDIYSPSNELGVEAVSSGGGEEVNRDAFDDSSSDFSWEGRALS